MWWELGLMYSKHKILQKRKKRKPASCIDCGADAVLSQAIHINGIHFFERCFQVIELVSQWT